MKSIKENITNEIIINKSRFIAQLIKVKNIDDVNEEIDNIKKKYKDATHYCYAYIIDNQKRFNDDGEPGGTAGMPILNVLENNDLNYILCVVIRYFGGIKLGAGGLVRAYTKSVTEALINTSIIELIDGYRITIEFNYDKNKMVDNILKDYLITNKVFDENIFYTFVIPKEKYESILNYFELNEINMIKKESILI